MGGTFLQIHAIDKNYPVLYESPTKNDIQEKKDQGDPYQFKNVINSRDSFFVYPSNKHLQNIDNFTYKYQRQNDNKNKIIEFKDKTIFLRESIFNNPINLSLFNLMIKDYDYYGIEFEIDGTNKQDKAVQIESLDLLDNTHTPLIEFDIKDINIYSFLPFIDGISLSRCSLLNDLKLHGRRFFIYDIAKFNGHGIDLHIENIDNTTNGYIHIESIEDPQFWRNFTISQKSVYTGMLIEDCKDVNLTKSVLSSIDKLELQNLNNLHIDSLDMIQIDKVYGCNNCQIDTMIIPAEVFAGRPDFKFEHSNIHINKLILKDMDCVRFCGVKSVSKGLIVEIDEIECTYQGQPHNTITIEPTTLESHIKYKGLDINRKKKVKI